MSFNQETKARIFIKCARICCLCFKQCGVNIEAAHIISELEHGSNDEDNGIPVCFDCHQEIGAYDNKHPKGNKFTVNELKARRNKVYQLVESGFLQAQIITGKIHNLTSKEDLDISKIEVDYKPTSEVQQVLSLTKSSHRPAESVPLKLQLLNKQDQAYIIDNLVEDVENRSSLFSLISIISSDLFKDSGLVILEQILRRVTISNNLSSKKDFMETVPTELLKLTDEGLRKAFFTEIIGIIEFNQFKDVNKIVPSVAYVQEAIPDSSIEKYLNAMLQMAKSLAWRGKPAAQKALIELPDRFVVVALEIFNDKRFLFWHRDNFYKSFLKKQQRFFSGKKYEIINDFITMTEKDFFEKWPMDWLN